MIIRGQFGLAAMAMLFSAGNLPAQSPLEVEVRSRMTWNWELTSVTVKNISSVPIELAVPVNESKDPHQSSVNPLPIDVERHDRQKWNACRPSDGYSIRQTPRKTLKAGETAQFKFAVGGGSGEYRVRVWYFMNYRRSRATVAPARIR